MKLFRKRNFFEKIYYRNKEFIKYSLVSFICTLILYLLYFFLTWITKGNYIFANLVAYIVSFTILYIWDKAIFKSRLVRKKERLKQLIAFILFRIVGFLADSFILVLLIEEFKMPHMLAKVLSSLITFMFNYITNKLFVFKKNKLL